ncbi:unnamed protein product [Gordionus sp. m RMFG-2023]
MSSVMLYVSGSTFPFHYHINAANVILLMTIWRFILYSNRNPGRQTRHLKCNQITSLALRSAGFPTSMEPSGLFSDSRRPDGVTRIPWSQGKFLIGDFSCLDTNSPSNFNKDALNRAQNFKISKYRADSSNDIFIHIICSTLTTYGDLAKNFFKDVGRLIRKNSGEPREGFYLRQRFAIAILKANYVYFINSVSPDD